MRRRILLAIIAVTTVATVVLTVPLAVINSRRENDQAIRELSRVSERAMAELPTPLASEPIDLPRVEPDVELGIYRPDGTRLTGRGPDHADAITAGVKRVAATGVIGDARVYAQPVQLGENKIAVIRVAEPVSDTTRGTRSDLLILLGFDIVAVAVAALVGWFVAARLARPVREIRDDAVRLGEGDFSLVPHRSGISELDETAVALAETAERLGAMLARERAFSADASHQLRTPLAALRLGIETELLDPRPDSTEVLNEAINEVDRLEGTVATLLDLARDRPAPRSELDVGALTGDVRQRWVGPLAEQGRTLTIATSGRVSAHVSRAVLEQILEILIGNAVDHGRGRVAIEISEAGGNLSVSVADEGDLERDATQLFTRRDPEAAGHGVGLYLARSLAEAEGGRMVLMTSSPTAFRLILPG